MSWRNPTYCAAAVMLVLPGSREGCLAIPVHDPGRALASSAADPSARAADFLVANFRTAGRLDEPLFGLLPATVGVALRAAGRLREADEIEEELLKVSGRIESTPARVAVLTLLVLHPTASGNAWTPRQELILRWMQQLNREELLEDFERRNHLLGAPGVGAAGASLRARSMPQFHNPLLLACIASALRGTERVGFTLDVTDRDVPESWQRLADWAESRMQKDGVHWPQGRAERTATLATGLCLALSRTAVLPRLKLDSAWSRRHDRYSRAINDCIDALQSEREIQPPSDPWRCLYEALLEARIVNCLGGRRIDTVSLKKLLDLQAADGSFDCEGELPFSHKVRDLAAYYESAPVRRLLCSALAVIALKEWGRSFDCEAQSATWERARSLAARSRNAEEQALLADLVACDGDAGIGSMLAEFLQGAEPPVPLAARALESRTGWDFGLTVAGNDEKRRRGAALARRWLVAESSGAAPARSFASRLGGVLVVLCEEPKELFLSFWERLRREPGGVDDLVAALEGGAPETVRACLVLLEHAGAPDLEWPEDRSSAAFKSAGAALRVWIESLED